MRWLFSLGCAFQHHLLTPPWTFQCLFPGVPFEANDKVILRYDGARIDGTEWEKRKEDTESGLSNLDNCYALGHMVNHPRREDFPNIMAFPIEFNPTELKAMGLDRCLIPYANHENWYYSTEWNEMIKTPVDLPFPGLVMFSTRFLSDGTELLFDYNLGMDQYPEWYAERDVAADVKHESST
eukprot:m.82299 g.82299  ORF g.82299 m.82299 type:complete len:182 (+) comp12862_c0_seq2:420-965(+)